jgi:hypothetical protein
LQRQSIFEQIQPRLLRYRSHYKIYLGMILFFSCLLVFYWLRRFLLVPWQVVVADSSFEIWTSLSYFLGSILFYFIWLKHKLEHSVQVFSDHICIHHQRLKYRIDFSDVESVEIVGWSVFYLKMKSGIKHFFSSSLERVDYVWEGIYQARHDLITFDQYEAFLTKLVQYDHNQKRKEWFFRHRLVDVFNWIILPTVFLLATYFTQLPEIKIYNHGTYFFRLLMYAFLILLVTTFFYSFIVNKFIFDKRLKLQMGQRSSDKLRDLEFEGIVVHRSKIFQMITAVFIFTLVVKNEMNLYSLTRLKQDFASFNLKQGHTLIVDNRFNCLACKYPVRDGDLVVFGRGTLGQVMATEGDFVGQISQDQKGRIIASENVQEVPKGHLAIKLADQNEVVMIQIDELIGKIQK